jgi:hypothetical protein
MTQGALPRIVIIQCDSQATSADQKWVSQTRETLKFKVDLLVLSGVEQGLLFLKKTGDYISTAVPDVFVTISHEDSDKLLALHGEAAFSEGYESCKRFMVTGAVVSERAFNLAQLGVRHLRRSGDHEEDQQLLTNVFSSWNVGIKTQRSWWKEMFAAKRTNICGANV